MFEKSPKIIDIDDVINLKDSDIKDGINFKTPVKNPAKKLQKKKDLPIEKPIVPSREEQLKIILNKLNEKKTNYTSENKEESMEEIPWI